MHYCFDMNLSQNENEVFSALVLPVVGKPVMKVPGAFSGGLFLDPPVRDWRAVFDSFFFLTE